MAVPVCVALWVRHQRRNKRSPLTVQLLRAPGETLSREIELVTEDLDGYVVTLVMLPMTSFSMYLSLRYLGNQTVNWMFIAIPCLAAIAYLVYKLSLLMKRRYSLRLGLDCERAVGQELDQLMLDGFRVYHDFPADGFNIDHIVIGQSGVFAVETKGRAKPVKGDVKVTYDGQGLQFPTHYESGPFEQAKRQADWLSKWLTSAVGAQVAVRPVLVFPGWFIERKKPGLLIYNGKNPRPVYKNGVGESLSAEMIQRIAHQVEQRCRDVEATAYKWEKRKTPEECAA
jgi:hypothetical protein